MNLGFLITNKCNAKCGHCSTDCGPQENQRLTLQEIQRLMAEAAALDRSEKLRFCISGGEPFLFWDDLVLMVRYGCELGADVSCVSNGFWATNAAEATRKLATLKDAGLMGIAISTSEYHQAFVPLARVAEAVRASKSAGLRVMVKFPYTTKGLQPEELVAALSPELMDGVELESFAVMPRVRTGFNVALEDLKGEPGIPQGRCPRPVITVREDGQAYMCCTPGGFIEPLRIGDIRSEPLSEIKERFEFGDMQQVLLREGPAFLTQRIREKRQDHLLRASYSTVCDLCTHILGEPALRESALEAVEEYQIHRLSETFRQLIEEAAVSPPG